MRTRNLCVHLQNCFKILNCQCVNNPVTPSIPQSPELMLLFWRVIANVKTRFTSLVEEEPVMWTYWVALMSPPNRRDPNKHDFWALQPNSISWASGISFASGIDSKLKPKQQGNDLAAKADLESCALSSKYPHHRRFFLAAGPPALWKMTLKMCDFRTGHRVLDESFTC